MMLGPHLLLIPALDKLFCFVMQNMLSYPPGLAALLIGYGAPSTPRPRTVPPHK